MQVKTLAALVSVIVGIGATLTLIGIELPKLATQQHLTDHEIHERIVIERLESQLEMQKLRFGEQLAEVAIDTYNNAAESYQLRIIELEERIEQKRRNGEDVTSERERLKLLERRLRSTDQKIESILEQGFTE